MCHNMPTFGGLLLSAGLDLASFDGLMSHNIYEALVLLPSPVSNNVAATVALCLLSVVAHEHAWKPRCAATIVLKHHR